MPSRDDDLRIDDSFLADLIKDWNQPVASPAKIQERLKVNEWNWRELRRPKGGLESEHYRTNIEKAIAAHRAAIEILILDATAYCLRTLSTDLRSFQSKIARRGAKKRRLTNQINFEFVSFRVRLELIRMMATHPTAKNRISYDLRDFWEDVERSLSERAHSFHRAKKPQDMTMALCEWLMAIDTFMIQLANSIAQPHEEDLEQKSQA